jgi:hypothetical protein
MTDTTMNPITGINRKQFREAISAPNLVRVYNSAPGTVTLQLRREKDFTTVNLSLEKAEQLSCMLLDAIRDSH